MRLLKRRSYGPARSADDGAEGVVVLDDAEGVHVFSDRHHVRPPPPPAESGEQEVEEVRVGGEPGLGEDREGREGRGTRR